MTWWVRRRNESREKGAKAGKYRVTGFLWGTGMESPRCHSFSYKNTTNEQFVETNSEVSFFSSVAKSIDCPQTVDKHVNQFKGEEEGGGRRRKKKT